MSEIKWKREEPHSIEWRFWEIESGNKIISMLSLPAQALKSPYRGTLVQFEDGSWHADDPLVADLDVTPTHAATEEEAQAVALMMWRMR